MSERGDDPGEPRYQLTLYVSGASERSARAVTDATAFCDQRLAGQYRLTVVDLYAEPDRATAYSVLVAPALVRDLPLPVRRIAGDLSNAHTVSSALELPIPAGISRAR